MSYVLVVGAGRTGRAVARFLVGQGESVVLTDSRSDALADGMSDVPASVRLELGDHPEAIFLGAKEIVVSPGVPDIAPIRTARRAGIPIVGEIELASRHLRGTIVGVTGTNGKSTTTELCGVLCSTTGRPTFVGGNLGTPLIAAAATAAAGADGICVVELSSFQLETISSFRCHVAVLLDVTPDHLDRYAGFEAYASAKARIFLNQTERDHAVVSGTDATALLCADNTLAERHLFAKPGALYLADESPSAWVDGSDMVVQMNARASVEHYPLSQFPLPGTHNIQNALAALLAARHVGVTYENALACLSRFQSLPHRMELVTEAMGVRFYDDSKGTNVGATVAALEGVDRPFVLIAGGKDKGGSYAPLAQVLRGKCRAAVLIGEAAPLMERVFAELAPTMPVAKAPSMDAAVTHALGYAQPGDAVILSPACSSFDMFRDYEERARAYVSAVRKAVPCP